MSLYAVFVGIFVRNILPSIFLNKCCVDLIYDNIKIGSSGFQKVADEH